MHNRHGDVLGDGGARHDDRDPRVHGAQHGDLHGLCHYAGTGRRALRGTVRYYTVHAAAIRSK